MHFRNSPIAKFIRKAGQNVKETNSQRFSKRAERKTRVHKDRTGCLRSELQALVEKDVVLVPGCHGSQVQEQLDIAAKSFMRSGISSPAYPLNCCVCWPTFSILCKRVIIKNRRTCKDFIFLFSCTILFLELFLSFFVRSAMATLAIISVCPNSIMNRCCLCQTTWQVEWPPNVAQLSG